MQIKNKIFPYPILNNNPSFSNYTNSSFVINYSTDENNDEYILKGVHFETNSSIVNELCDDNKITVYLIIECSETVYRKKFKIDKTPKDITLLKSDFSEKVEISMFACANENINIVSNEFDEDYRNINFEIEKYDILCANDGFYVTFQHDESESNLVKSIFSIIPSDSIDDGRYEINCEIGRKITISMSNDSYNNCKIIDTVPVYKEVIFNMLLVPALIEGLSICKNFIQEGAVDLDDVTNKYVWFRSILSTYKRFFGIELTKEDFINESPALLAQKLLGMPLGESLTNLVRETTQIDKETSDNE
ncbi:MAG: hypothetical protein K5765_05990 [Clostridia bacterium]|nr:hypothetical protein [Clostridia bacterium]